LVDGIEGKENFLPLLFKEGIEGWLLLNNFPNPLCPSCISPFKKGGEGKGK